MPSYHTTSYRSYDRSMEMLGHSMMLATISEDNCGYGGSIPSSQLGLKRASNLSKSCKTGLADLAAQSAQQPLEPNMIQQQQQQQQSHHHHQHYHHQQQQQELTNMMISDDDAWGFFMDDA